MENETGGTVKKSTDGGPEKTIAIWAGVAVVLIILAVVAIPAFAEYFKKGQAGAALPGGGDPAGVGGQGVRGDGVGHRPGR